jgi:hypothetical protein
MGIFAVIIFTEKIWSRGIWIARVSGIGFIIIGMLSTTGLIPISTEEDGIHYSHNEMNSMMMKDSSQDRDNIDKNMKDNKDMKRK